MKRNREYFYIAFRVLVILIAIGAGQVLKGLADVMNTTYDGTNYYRAFIISIIIISALIVISIKRMNIKKIHKNYRGINICNKHYIHNIKILL